MAYSVLVWLAFRVYVADLKSVCFSLTAKPTDSFKKVTLDVAAFSKVCLSATVVPSRLDFSQTISEVHRCRLI